MAWEKLGSSKVTGAEYGGETLKSTADFEDDFSSDNWTDVGNTGVSGGVLSYNGIANGSDHRSHTSLGLTLNDTKFTMRFKYRVSAQNIPSMWILGLVDSTGNPTGTTQDALVVFHSETYKFGLATKNASSAYIDGSATDSDVSISLDTDYYVELARTSATNLRLKVFTDSSYTTQTGTTLNLTISSSIGSLDNITTATQTGGSSVRTLTSQVDDLEIYDDSANIDASTDTITVDGFTAKKHLMIQAKCINSGTARTGVRFKIINL